MWEGHALGNPILGDPESIKSFNPYDIIEFLKKNYTPENIIISVVGDKISRSVLRSLVSGKFKALNILVQKDGNESIPLRAKKIDHIHLNTTKDTNLIYYSIGINSLHRTHPDRVVLFALSSMLGEGLNSRLFRRLRFEGGYTYDIKSSYQLFSEGGILSISGMSNSKTFPDVLKGVEIELKNLVYKAATQEEIEIVRNRLKSNLIFNLENPELRAIRLAKLESWFMRIFSIEEELDMIRDVTAERIKDLAVRLLSNGASLCTAGDSNNIGNINLTI